MMEEDESLQARAKLAVTSEVEEMLVVLRYGDGEGEGSAGGYAAGEGGLLVPGGNNGTGELVALGGQPRWDPSAANITITVFAAFIIFCTLAGNALVITAVIKERRLRKVRASEPASESLVVVCLLSAV